MIFNKKKFQENWKITGFIKDILNSNASLLNKYILDIRSQIESDIVYDKLAILKHFIFIYEKLKKFDIAYFFNF